MRRLPYVGLAVPRLHAPIAIHGWWRIGWQVVCAVTIAVMNRDQAMIASPAGQKTKCRLVARGLNGLPKKF